MQTEQTGQADPHAGHAHPIDPAATAVQDHGDQHRLQEVLPEIRELAQKVGGMKRLAEIAETLEQAQEE